MAGDSLFHSPANTITLTGRGQIVFSETGYAVSRSLRGSGDFVITISNYMQRDFDRSFPLILEALGL